MVNLNDNKISMLNFQKVKKEKLYISSNDRYSVPFCFKNEILHGDNLNKNIQKEKKTRNILF